MAVFVVMHEVLVAFVLLICIGLVVCALVWVAFELISFVFADDVYSYKYVF